MSIHNICQLLHSSDRYDYVFPLISLTFFLLARLTCSVDVELNSGVHQKLGMSRHASKENQDLFPLLVLSVKFLRFYIASCCVLPPLLMRSMSRQIKQTKRTILANSEFVKTRKLLDLKNFTKRD